MEGSLLRSPSPFLICLNVFLVLNKQKSLTTMNEDTILVSVPTVQFLKVTGKSCRKPSFPSCLRQQSTFINFFHLRGVYRPQELLQHTRVLRALYTQICVLRAILTQ